MAEDLGLKLAQLRARLDAELVDETGAGSLIHVQSLRLPARTVQRDHELAQEAFPQRVLGDEPFELADDVAVATELEVGVDSLGDGDEAELLEPPDLRLRKGLKHELGENRSAPHLERADELRTALIGRKPTRVRQRSARSAAHRPARGRCAGRTRAHVSRVVRTQRLAELRDPVLQ